MNFDQIQTFYLVAMMRTPQQAAERLNTTQPAISARIAALEKRLNVKLFDRSGHRVALTPHGRKFLAHAEQLLDTRSQALLDLGQAGEMSGVVRIGAADVMISSWLPDFLISMHCGWLRSNIRKPPAGRSIPSP